MNSVSEKQVKAVTFFPKPVLQRIDAIAKANGLSRSMLIKTAIMRVYTGVFNDNMATDSTATDNTMKGGQV